MEHIIWQDRIYQNDKDWEGYAEEFCDINGIEFKEEDRFQYEDDMNIEYLNAEKNYNLNIETKHHIICIADVGRWDGRKTGYKILGKNVNCIFGNLCEDSNCYARYYVDEQDVKGSEAHHDGTNYYVFRELNMDKDDFEDLLYEDKEHWNENLYKYTTSLRPYVKKVYGFKD